ncbi:cache domain-containing sensor histidine kinase [Paenibacillus sp. y28]|uniref:cache domain-containing sensor histidine kinase n=1 Tax=Paenibacillus sp. y28 TaxID=3129110 RepID=UPI003017CCC2
MRTRFFVKNMLLFLFPLLIPVLMLGTLSIVVTKQYIQGEISRNNMTLFNQVDRSMELLMNEIEALNVSLGNADVLYRLEEVMRTQTLTLENLRLMKTIQNFMTGPANAKPYLESVYVYVNNGHGHFLTSGAGLAQLSDFHDTDWKDSFERHADRTGVWAESRQVRRYSFEAPYRVTTLYKNLVSTVQSRPSGVIVLNVYTDYMEKLLDNLVTLPNQRLFVLDEAGRVVLASHTEEGTAPLEAGQIPAEAGSFNWSSGGTSYFVSQTAAKSGWRYLSVTPRDSLNQIPFRLSAMTVWVVLLSFALGLVVTYILTRRNVRHIRSIIAVIQHAEQGFPLPSAAASDRTDEYGYIARKIIANFIERHYLTMQLTEKKYKLQTAELLALQAQINPHFLFNTLETIYWKVLGLTGKPNEANRMLEHLSGLLKYSLHTPGEMVPLSKEIENAQSYIRLQKVRYQERFQVDWQVEAEELEEAGVIKLLLQPLLENCIQHGIRGMNMPGTSRIKIKILRFPEYIRIAVIDNGTGMSRGRLEEIRRRIQSEDEGRGHIGLANTHKRIRLAYQMEEGLKIYSKLGWGTVIAMHLPVRGAADKKAGEKTADSEPGGNRL